MDEIASLEAKCKFYKLLFEESIVESCPPDDERVNNSEYVEKSEEGIKESVEKEIKRIETERQK